VEIHACGVASATDLCKPNRGTECVVGPGTERGFAGYGYRLLRAIADATGVPARAPLHAQNAAVNFVALGGYQGPTVEVHP